jgi:outer membrane protein OmpA-like peptidoglycan-associated protein
MGKILKIQKFTTLFEFVILIFGLGIVGTGVYYLAPGLRVGESKQLKALDISKENIDNAAKGSLMSLPSFEVSTAVSNKPLTRIAEYAWNGNTGMIGANGGPRTTKGSIMESLEINLEIVRQDMVGGLRDMMIKFVEEFANGSNFPVSDKSAPLVSIMGDGGPFFIATLQSALDEKFGAGKFHVQVVGAIGLSYGEDKLIGPKEWKENPQLMKGALISSVVGDGDWVLNVNHAFACGLRVNPDATTYDEDAVNFTPSKDDDYIQSVKELIQSQKTGYTVPLKEVKNGKLTGKTINKKIDGATTWTPGDKMAFEALSGFTDIVSTKDYNNQMATTIITIKEWAVKNDKLVSNLLKGTYIANNQIKQYDEWRVKAAEAVAKTYNLEDGKYWYDLFKGQKGTKDGVEFHVGGTKVLNYADAMQYYGITDGNNRYKSVYNQVSSYLTELNPCGFNQSVKSGVVPYDEAVNLYFLKNINDIDAGKTEKVDYTATKTEVMATGEWHINFATGSNAISGSDKDLQTIYNLLIQAENTKLTIIGHTDNTGNSQANMTLSKGRANSVVEYLVNKGISSDRFQLVDGKGDTDPTSENNTSVGKAKNRRVVITLLK